MHVDVREVGEVRHNCGFAYAGRGQIMNLSQISGHVALHNGRITSSKAGQVFHRRPTTSPDEPVASLMGYDQKKFVTAAVSWGKRNETIAQKAYIAHMQNHGHPGLKVLPAGFTMYSSATHIGASSDGLVIDPSASNSTGCLEIKCPFSVDGYQITDFMPQEIPLIAGSKFFMEEIQNNSSISLQLRRSSKHYCQVMCEMAVLEVLCCDFLVWTPAGCTFSESTLMKTFGA